MNVVEDIYKELDKLNDGPLDIPEETLQNFGLAMTQVIKEGNQYEFPS